MPGLLQTISAYVPPNIVQNVLEASAPAPPSSASSERFSAAVLFADITGFTPLTELLGQRGAEGPEELTRLLNRYFSWMIAFIETQGGEIVKFGGDSLTAVFRPKNNDLGAAVRRARQAAETMQSVMDEFNIMESSAGLVSLEMEVGIGAGELLAAHVGGLFNRWEYIIAGDPLHQAAQAEFEAQPRQIVLSPAAKELIYPHSISPNPLPHPDWTNVVDSGAVESVLRCYVPRPVLAWLDEELHGWLASLRPMSVLFVGVQGLDYDQDDAIQKLHAFVRDVQQVINHYQGSLPRLTVDDKGTVLLILFGAPPNAHEDDPERALRCGLDLQALTQMHDVQLTIGVTTGRVFAGPVGSATRREYTVMGDTVNLAARLMAVAEPGQICCNYETYRSARNQMRFDPLPPVRVKGKGSPIQIYRPTGKRRSLGQTDELNRVSETPVPISVMIGRRAELDRLHAGIEKVQAGQGRIVVLEGEAGIGKSKLIRSLVESISDANITPLIGRGRSVDQETAPYHPWQDVFYYYINHSGSSDSGQLVERQQQLMDDIDRVAPQLTKYLPLLNAFSNLGLPENDLTLTLNPALRHQYLVSLVVALLQAWTLENEKPLMLVLEDAHWLDVASWDLTLQLARSLVAEPLPLYLIIATRSWAGSTMPPELLALTEMPETQHFHLDTISPENTLTVSAARLGLTGNELPEPVAELIRRRAGGNPFFAEELIYSLLDDEFIALKTPQNKDGSAGKTRCLVSGDLEQADQLLPSTIQSTVLARVDGLPPEEQLMLRIAAVIGQTFSYSTLRSTLNQHLDMDEASIKAHLNDMVYLDLIQPIISPPNLTYGFKHIITREVTYQSLPFDRRRELHGMVAQWYEDTFSDDSTEDSQPAPDGFIWGNGLPVEVETLVQGGASSSLMPYYSVLVYHWHQAENEERERHYATLIAKQTAAQFANAEALGYLNRALDLTPRNNLVERYKLLLARETVYNRRGNRDVQGQDLSVLAELARQIEGDQFEIQVMLRQAHFAEATSDYPAAALAAEQIVGLTQQIQDVTSETQGYLIWGQSLCQQGDYEAAQEKVEQALSLSQTSRHRANEAASLYFLAGIHRLRGEYDLAEQNCRQVLDICTNDPYCTLRADILTLQGIIQYQLEHYPSSRDYFEDAILVYYTRGKQRGCLKPFYYIGLMYHYQGNYDAARDYFEQALLIARNVGDREAEAQVLSGLGMVRCYLGDYDTARSYLAHSLEIREEIGSRVGQVDSFNKLGIVYHFLGQHRTSQRYCDHALETLKTVTYKEGECYSLTYLGHAQTELGLLQEAIASYEKALAMRKEMKQSAAIMDILAGLARVALLQEDLETALNYVAEISNFLAANTVDGIDGVLQVYDTMYRVLEMAGADEANYAAQARDVLNSAHAILQNQLALIGDKALRRIFLEGVTLNQKIKTAWEKQAETV